MMQNRRKARSYCYRIPLDDRRAIRKIHRLDVLDSGYWIDEVSDKEIPHRYSGKNFAVNFYRSTEHRDFETDSMVGGTIPGLEEYRYSLDWEECPIKRGFEMKNAAGGGTRIRGSVYRGAEDPYIPNDVEVDFTVPWTPTEIGEMAQEGCVENKTRYSYTEKLLGGRYVSRRPDELEGKYCLRAFSEELGYAVDDAMDELEEKLLEFRDDCEHQHVVETGSKYGTKAFCEDCGKEWHDDRELDAQQEAGELNVVGMV